MWDCVMEIVLLLVWWERKIFEKSVMNDTEIYM